MTTNAKYWTALLSVGLITAAFCWMLLAQQGHTDDNVRVLLRLTARLTYLLWVIVFIARPLQQLFNTGLTQKLLRNRPLIGLSLGAIFLVHLALILYRTQVNPEFSIVFPRAITGVIAYTLIVLMIITTFSGPRRAIGPRSWRILHKVGLYYVGAALIFTLLPWRAGDFFTPDYVWFTVSASLAMFIRLTAWFATRER